METENRNSKTINLTGGVLRLVQHHDQLVRMAHSQARIRVDEARVRELVNKILSYIDLFNSLGEYETRVLDHDLSEIKVIDEFAPFIIPSKVKVDSMDVLHTNLLVLSSQPSEGKSYPEFVELQAQFRGLFKKDISDRVSTLESVKSSQSLNAVLDKLTVPGPAQQGLITRYVGAPFIPILMNNNLRYLFNENAYFNSTTAQVLEDYITQLRF